MSDTLEECGSLATKKAPAIFVDMVSNARRSTESLQLLFFVANLRELKLPRRSVGTSWNGRL